MSGRRVIAKVSGGEGSWLAARTYINRHQPERFEVLFTDTLIEDQDTYRFLIAGAANLFGIALPPGFLPEIADFPAWEDRDAYKAFVTDLAARTRALMPGFHWIADGRDPFDVYEDERFLGNSSADPCSKILKRELSDRWLRANCDPAETIILVGIDDTERARFEGSERLGTRGLKAQMAEAGWQFSTPAPRTDGGMTAGEDLIKALEASGDEAAERGVVAGAEGRQADADFCDGEAHAYHEAAALVLGALGREPITAGTCQAWGR